MRYQVGSDVRDREGFTVRAVMGSFAKAKELCDALNHRHKHAFWVFDTRKQEIAYSRSAIKQVLCYQGEEIEMHRL